MAPWNDDRDSVDAEAKRRAAEEEANPFIAFRRFADEQFNTLVNGLNDLPRMLSEMHSKANEEQRQWERSLRGEVDKWEARADKERREKRGCTGGWTDNVSPRPSPTEVPDEARDAARLLLNQARNINSGVDPRRIEALYADSMNTFWESRNFGALQAVHPWLSIDWFRDSPYSPIQVEQGSHTHQQGSMWRAAFEDLLSETLGKEQEAWPAWSGRVNDQSKYSSWAQSGTDWMLGLQCRGVLPPQLPSLYKLDGPDRARNMHDWWRYLMSGNITHGHGIPSQQRSRAILQDFERLASEIATFDEDEIAAQTAHVEKTELDVYEAFLGKAHNGMEIGSDKANTAVQKLPSNATLSPDTAEKSPILSTLSMTEQTTLPDGTITTKVVLKKRFADGREESTETVSTTHSQQTNISGQKEQIEANDDTKKDNEKSNSWFWS